MRTFRLKKFVPDRPVVLSGETARVLYSKAFTSIAGPSRIIEGGGRVRRRRLSWDPSQDPDLAGYRVYWAVNERVGYESNFADVGQVTAIVLPDDVTAFPRTKGQMEIGITAVSVSGNESDMCIVEAFMDFTRPERPSNLKIEAV